MTEGAQAVTGGHVILIYDRGSADRLWFLALTLGDRLGAAPPTRRFNLPADLERDIFLERNLSKIENSLINSYWQVKRSFCLGVFYLVLFEVIDVN